MVIHKIHAKSGGTKLSDCKVEVKNFQKNLYISQHLGINCYVNFLGHLGCVGFQLKRRFGAKIKILMVILELPVLPNEHQEARKSLSRDSNHHNKTFNKSNFNWYQR